MKTKKSKPHTIKDDVKYPNSVPQLTRKNTPIQMPINTNTRKFIPIKEIALSCSLLFSFLEI